MAIGTTAAIIGAAAIGAGGSIISGAMGSRAASKAADAQERAALASVDLQREQFNTARADAMPWMEVGKSALNQLQTEMGIAPGKSAFRETPGYQFQVEEGEKGVLNNLAALGMKNSGAALKALTRFRQGLADQTYGNYLNRLSSLAGTGQTQVNSTNTLGANMATNVGQTMQQAGAARASGYMGSANAWQNAISSGVGNITGALGMLSYRPQNALGGFPAAPALGGGLY